MLAYPGEAFHWDGDLELLNSKDLVSSRGDSGYATAKANYETTRLNASNKQQSNPTQTARSPKVEVRILMKIVVLVQRNQSAVAELA